MNIQQSFLLALKSILSSKTRALLTMLGIIIGVSAVIVIISLGNGMSKTMEETFESMGTNLLTVNIMGRGSSRAVQVDDLYTLTEENPDVLSAVTPNIDVSVTVKNASDSFSTTASGVGEDFCQIKNYAVSTGRFLQYIDIAQRKKVAVIGTYIANTCFGGSANAVGQQLKLNGSMYTVVGVLEEKAGSEEGSDDDHIYLPYSIATKLSWMSQISTYYFSATSENATSKAKTLIENALYKVYEDEDAYTVTSMSESLENLTSLTDTLVLVLAAIAAISLLVGGIGIMNIMLVSVTERTREIGIRKSLGAKRRDIMRQFVIEAGTVSALGGIVGIVLGAVLSVLAGRLFDMTASPSVGAILLAFSVSLGIGVVFGFLPANKAAKLRPIDALRYD